MAILPLQLARVSNLLRSNVATGTIAHTQQELLNVQNELSTGKKLNLPSDDPGTAAIAQQLRKTLEQRQAYGSNIRQATDQLSEVDSSLGDLTDLLRQAQTLASANVGSDVTPDQRANAATVLQSIYDQALSVGNKQFEGIYLFGGDRSTSAPFVEEGGGVKFVGSETVLANQYDENTTLPFMANGANIFGALSTRVQGTVDLSPALSLGTRLADLTGTTGDGVHPGSIQISDGTTTETVDLSAADTVNDIITRINAAGVGGITASISTGGQGITLAAGPADNITVTEVGGGATAGDLGILAPAGAGAGIDVTGAALGAALTPLTQLSDLRGGAGIDTTSGLQITNGLRSATINLSSATTVEDMLNAINGSNTGVRAEINAAGTGINILNPTQGTDLRIAENGGTTAADLGIRSFNPNSPLAEMNEGTGVRTVNGADFTITDSNGNGIAIDLTSEHTIQDVLNTINNAVLAGGVGVTASFAATGNGIVLTDTAGGGGTLTAAANNYSNALADLGLTATQSGGVIAGTDVSPVQATGIFANIIKLRDALSTNDQIGITAAAEGLQTDQSRVTRSRGEVGARVQALESRQNRLDDQNLATKALLSSLEDTDFTDAISRFQTLQTALQANLQTSSRMLNLSLLDFLG